MRTPRIAITGVTGFVGRHLVEAARAAKVEVVGITLHPTNEDQKLDQQLNAKFSADLTNEFPEIGEVDAVIHLAGLSAVGPSFTQPQRYISDNSAMVTHLGEAMLERQGRAPRIVGISSGAVYAQGVLEALTEEAAVASSSPYVVSKLLVEHQYNYYSARGLDVVVARPFNHIGPGQSLGFLLPDLVASLLNLREEGEVLSVGNLNTSRDYTDVRDVAAAYLHLALTDRPLASLYNIASGRSLLGWEILAMAANALGLSVPPTSTDPHRMRATDISRVTGDARALNVAIGWEPSIRIEQSVHDYVRDLRAN